MRKKRTKTAGDLLLMAAAPPIEKVKKAMRAVAGKDGLELKVVSNPRITRLRPLTLTLDVELVFPRRRRVTH